MLEGTKKLFPNDYKKFVSAMVQAAEDDSLPVLLQLDSISDYTLKDLQDLFIEFNKDTSLSIEGHVSMCNTCGQMHLLIEVNYADDEDAKMIQ